MTTYNDLEIACLVDAVDDYARRGLTESSAKGHDLQRILQETAHVLDLLGEPQAAAKLGYLAQDLGVASFSVQEELDELKEELDRFLSDEFDCSSMAEVSKTSWLQVPKGVSTSDAEYILEALAEMPSLNVYDALEALRTAAGKND